jgi:uncharacterized protein (TIGR00288 family)
VEKDQSPSNSAGRRIALLIDADNISHTTIASMLAELSKYGTANIRRAYGNWASPSLKGWTEKLHKYAIRPIQQFSYTAGKNASDIAMVIDAMELLYTQKLDAFCVASSDADFTPLIMQLKANGQDVYGFGERKTPEAFVNACTTFLYLDSLQEAPEVKDIAEKPVSAKQRKVTEPQPALVPSPRSAHAELLSALRGAVAAAVRDDGWALLATAGGAVRRQGPIDPRNYGYKNFARLFEATRCFEIVKASDGRNYISDLRNSDRAAKPEI